MVRGNPQGNELTLDRILVLQWGAPKKEGGLKQRTTSLMPLA